MANHLVRGALIFTAGLVCTGCVAVWQNDHKIEASTREAVIIDYDPLLLTSDRVSHTAQVEWRRFQRVAVLDQVHSGRTWAKIAKYRCEKDPIALKGSIANLPSAQLTAVTTYRSLPPPFPTAAPPVASSKVASIPAVPPLAAPQATPTLTTPAQVGSVSFINAIGASWGITHRQVAKIPAKRTQAAKTSAASGSTQLQRKHAEPEHSLKASNLPVANLKGSLVS